MPPLDKNRVEREKTDAKEKIQREKDKLKNFEKSHKTAMNVYAEILNDDIDDDLKDRVLERQDEHIAEIEEQGKQHSEAILGEQLKLEDLSKEVKETADKSKKSYDNLLKTSKNLGKYEGSIMENAALDAKKNAESWKEDNKELMDYISKLDKIRKNFQDQ